MRPAQILAFQCGLVLTDIHIITLFDSFISQINSGNDAWLNKKFRTS